MFIKNIPLNKKLLIGKLIRIDSKENTARVRVNRMVLNEKLHMYFNNREHYDANCEEKLMKKLNIGDLVLIKENLIPHKESHLIEERIYELGNTIDPFTNKRCIGAKFVTEKSEEWKQLTEKIEEISPKFNDLKLKNNISNVKDRRKEITPKDAAALWKSVDEVPPSNAFFYSAGVGNIMGTEKIENKSKRKIVVPQNSPDYS
ncbi:hypothetical protein SNEBB_001379 [Seison nebaliae]|nr:hypothetical protein SNEBB_001379 [Seison nebaliae]